MSYLLIQAGLFFGFLVIILLLFFRKKSNHNNLFLALSIFCITYSLLVNNLNETQQILNYPYLIRTGNITGYLILPFLYCYARNTFYPGVYWRKRDWLFLVPALFYVADMIPFFFSDGNYKIAVMKANLANPARMFRVAEGWLGISGFHFVFRYLWSVLMMVLLLRLIIRNRNIEAWNPGSLNRSLYWFIITITALHIPLIVPGIFGVMFHLKWYSLQFLNINLTITLLSTTVFILFSPYIVYGFLPKVGMQRSDENPAEIKTEIIFADKIEPETVSGPKLYISNNEIKGMIEKIELYMEEKKPYLDQGYSIHDLGRDIQVHVYQLSPIINQYYKSNFNTWLNKYRVNHFISLCGGLDKPDLTFDAMAKESGFSNRTSFNNAFRKEKLVTPGTFLKNLHSKG